MGKNNTDKVALMEQAYRELCLLASEGMIEIDSILTDAMNATLALMLAVDRNELDPKEIEESPFLKFERNQEATLNWLYSRFVAWLQVCYPVNDEFLALRYFTASIRYPKTDGAKRDAEIRGLLAGITIVMKNRASELFDPKPGLVRESVDHVQKALSLTGSAFILIF